MYSGWGFRGFCSAFFWRASPVWLAVGRRKVCSLHCLILCVCLTTHVCPSPVALWSRIVVIALWLSHQSIQNHARANLAIGLVERTRPCGKQFLETNLQRDAKPRRVCWRLSARLNKMRSRFPCNPLPEHTPSIYSAFC